MQERGQNMAIRSEERGGELLFYVSGEIDHHNSVFLREEMDAKIASSTASRVVLDLSETDFCDSSALGLILGRTREASVCGKSLLVQRPSARVRKILDLCGAGKYLQFTERREDETHT